MNLLQKINKLKDQLNETARQSGNLTDGVVLQISQELDRYIVEYFRRELKNEGGRVLNQMGTFHKRKSQMKRPTTRRWKLLSKNVPFSENKGKVQHLTEPDNKQNKMNHDQCNWGLLSIGGEKNGNEYKQNFC